MGGGFFSKDAPSVTSLLYRHRQFIGLDVFLQRVLHSLCLGDASFTGEPPELLLYVLLKAAVEKFLFLSRSRHGRGLLSVLLAFCANFH